jgi:hypothetical protein
LQLIQLLSGKYPRIGFLQRSYFEPVYFMLLIATVITSRLVTTRLAAFRLLTADPVASLPVNADPVGSRLLEAEINMKSVTVHWDETRSHSFHGLRCRKN